MARQIGEISKGALADLIALPLPAIIGTFTRLVLHHQGNVMASMIDGEWAMAPD